MCAVMCTPHTEKCVTDFSVSYFLLYCFPNPWSIQKQNKNKRDDYKKQIYTDDISYWYAKKNNHPNKFDFVGRKAHTILQQDIMLR